MAAEHQFQVALGLLAHGDREQAHGALHARVAAGDPEWSPRASAMLGESLFEAGDLAWAEKAYRDVIAIGAAGPTPFAAKAGVNIGYVLFTARGDVAGARAAFQAAIAEGDPEQSELARRNLAAMDDVGPAPTTDGRRDRR